MKELLWLQQQCLERINIVPPCQDKCKIGLFCTTSGCKECDCSKCLNHIHWDNSPAFHYACERITYYYLLRFSNRFASEITHFVNLFKIKDNSEINVVSLGCGPASEIFGFIKSIQQRRVNTVLHFEGYDLNNVWEPLQELTKASLSSTQHIINFHTQDLFVDYTDFPNNQPAILVLNYLLSDIAKYYNESDKRAFINNVIKFICNHRISAVFFNDISYYGTVGRTDSGTQLMKLILRGLEQLGRIKKVRFYYFQEDPFRGSEQWQMHDSNSNLFQTLEDNKYLDNILYCKSKQIYLRIE